MKPLWSWNLFFGIKKIYDDFHIGIRKEIQFSLDLQFPHFLKQYVNQNTHSFFRIHLSLNLALQFSRQIMCTKMHYIQEKCALKCIYYWKQHPKCTVLGKMFWKNVYIKQNCKEECAYRGKSALKAHEFSWGCFLKKINKSQTCKIVENWI